MVSSVSDSKSSLGIIKDFFTLTLIFFKYSLIVQPPNYYPAWGIVHCTFLLFSFCCSFLLISLFHSTFTSFIVPFYYPLHTPGRTITIEGRFHCSFLLVSFCCTFLLFSLYLSTHTHFIIPFY